MPNIHTIYFNGIQITDRIAFTPLESFENFYDYYIANLRYDKLNEIEFYINPHKAKSEFIQTTVEYVVMFAVAFALWYVYEKLL